MLDAFVFSGSDPSGRSVAFSPLEQPHSDALTLVEILLHGGG